MTLLEFFQDFEVLDDMLGKKPRKWNLVPLLRPGYPYQVLSRDCQHVENMTLPCQLGQQNVAVTTISSIQSCKELIDPVFRWVTECHQKYICGDGDFHSGLTYDNCLRYVLTPVGPGLYVNLYLVLYDMMKFCSFSPTSPQMLEYIRTKNASTFIEVITTFDKVLDGQMTLAITNQPYENYSFDMEDEEQEEQEEQDQDLQEEEEEDGKEQDKMEEDEENEQEEEEEDEEDEEEEQDVRVQQIVDSKDTPVKIVFSDSVTIGSHYHHHQQQHQHTSATSTDSFVKSNPVSALHNLHNQLDDYQKQQNKFKAFVSGGQYTDEMMEEQCNILLPALDKLTKAFEKYLASFRVNPIRSPQVERYIENIVIKETVEFQDLVAKIAGVNINK